MCPQYSYMTLEIDFTLLITLPHRLSGAFCAKYVYATYNKLQGLSFRKDYAIYYYY